jgi:hypothetical protein
VLRTLADKDVRAPIVVSNPVEVELPSMSVVQKSVLSEPPAVAGGCS